MQDTPVPSFCADLNAQECAAWAAYVAHPRATSRTAHTVDRHRGRTETRTLRASTRLNAYPRTYFPCPRIAQVARFTLWTGIPSAARQEGAFRQGRLWPDAQR